MILLICTDTLVRNLSLWSVKELVSSFRFDYKSIHGEKGMEHKGLNNFL